ncbi:hypothetical protein GCM10028814_13640 [Angustibacter aerolatus]
MRAVEVDARRRAGDVGAAPGRAERAGHRGRRRGGRVGRGCVDRGDPRRARAHGTDPAEEPPAGQATALLGQDAAFTRTPATLLSDSASALTSCVICRRWSAVTAE